jgi:hypothetical protein
MRTKEPMIWDRVFAADDAMEIPAGTPVEWHEKNKAYYVKPEFFADKDVLPQDAIYLGCKVASNNVTCDGINLCEHLKDVTKCPDVTCPRK